MLKGPGFPEPAFHPGDNESIGEFYKTHGIETRGDLLDALFFQVPVGRLRAADQVLGDLVAAAGTMVRDILAQARKVGLTASGGVPASAQEEE